jgi:vesicle-associated membrane protein 7
MPILYALIARGKTVLAEYTFTSGNFPTITRVLLGKIDNSTDTRMSYVYDQFVFHYVCHDAIVYLCMCDDPNSTRRRLPFAFLEDARQRFLVQCAAAVLSELYPLGDAVSPGPVRAGGRAARCRYRAHRPRRARCRHFPTGTPAARAQVNKKLDDVKAVMVQNVECVLERGEKLELLVDKTDRLQASAFTFEKSSRRLKEAMFWKKIKIYALVCAVGLFAALIISMMICGVDYAKCSDDDDDGGKRRLLALPW